MVGQLAVDQFAFEQGFCRVLGRVDGFTRVLARVGGFLVGLKGSERVLGRVEGFSKGCG